MPGPRTQTPGRGRLAALLRGALAVLAAAAVPAGAAEPEPGPAPAARTQEAPSGGWQRALLDRYCVAYHNARLRTADLALDTQDVTRIAAAPAVCISISAGSF